MRANVSGCSSCPESAGLRERSRGLAVRDASSRAAEHVAKLVLGEPGEPRRPQREQKGAGLLPVRIVGGVEHLARRDAREHVEEVDGAPDGGVEVHARAPGEALGERGEVGDSGMRDDERRFWVEVVQPPKVFGNRRQAAPAVDEDRHAALGGECEDGLEPLVVEQEALRPGVELDPARAVVERAGRFFDRLLGEIEAHEGHEEAARALGSCERAVVGSPERRLPVGLVHAERERALHAPTLEEGGQIFERRDHPVDVATDVNVRVEERRPLRQQAPRLLLVELDQAARSLENGFHAGESTGSG